MKLRTRRIQKLIGAHPRVRTRSVRAYWDIYGMLNVQESVYTVNVAFPPLSGFSCVNVGSNCIVCL